ncbi:MAG TPA: M23 family metallopeptidase [Tepidisphaeraceae bacterium]|jgi:hypothetical protein|nr:M23 family metallopeptidase [Tepidisphaeraceae bacterium]
MAWTKKIAPGRIVWAFGKPYQFHPVKLYDGAAVVLLNDANYAGGTKGKKYQKTKIMLHATGGNSPGSGTADYMINISHYAAHLIVERTSKGTVGTPARAARTDPKLRADAVLDDGTDFVDVVQSGELYDWLAHGSNWNRSMIGIEHTNVENTWENAKDETLDAAAVAKNRRPRDLNRFYRLKATDGPPAFTRTEYQAYEDAQYNSMILMLRSICIEQRIPRQFFGDNWKDKARRRVPWKRVVKDGVPQVDANGNPVWEVDFSPGSANDREEYGRLERFRGIIRHSNVHQDKSCPGIIAYTRLYRGVTDEWWMPVEIDGAERKYYSGPFWNPIFTAPDNGGKPSKPSLWRWLGNAAPVGTTLNLADIEALTETRSYFNLTSTGVETYYKRCETRAGGLFPVGLNLVWHGGIHLEVKEGNPIVYAAASGTIVAARITSMKDTDEEPGFGSQRFVLIRHAVYWKTENDPDGPPSTGPDDPPAKRINYTGADAADGNPSNPMYVFSLYMHLGPLADPYSQADGNPRWYNLWLRKQALAKGLAPDADPPVVPSKEDLDKIIGVNDQRGRVFNPDIEVSVGDVLGRAGEFADFDNPKVKRQLVHFEITSHKDFEVTIAGNRSAKDLDENQISDVALINKEITAAGGSPLAAAPKLRDLRVLHMSTWGWNKGMAFEAILLDPLWGSQLLHVQRMMWFEDALAANPVLKKQLGDKPLFWHYHPITFMAAINRLIVAENREIIEAPWQGAVANVEVNDDYFLTDFFDYDATVNPPVWRPVAADAKKVEPYQEGKFSFTRADLACRESTAAPVVPHSPNVSPPRQTQFSLALLEIVQRVRDRLGSAVDISCAYVCSTHTVETSRCCRSDVVHIFEHMHGIAVDIRPPGNATPATVKALWAEVKTVCDDFNKAAVLHAGRACCGNLPSNYTKVEFKAQDDPVTAKLNAGTALSAAEARAFAAHIALVA